MCRTDGPEQGVKRVGVDYDAIELGAQIRVSKTARAGMMFRNALTISVKKHDSQVVDLIGADGHFSAPRYLTLGFSKQVEKWLFAVDSETIFGTYGGLNEKKARFWFLRAGIERKVLKHLNARLGLVVPVIAYTSTLGNIRDDLPDPKFGGAVGMGIKWKWFSADLAIYGDPARSYVDRKIALGSVLTSIFRF